MAVQKVLNLIIVVRSLYSVLNIEGKIAIHAPPKFSFKNTIGIIPTA